MFTSPATLGAFVLRILLLLFVTILLVNLYVTDEVVAKAMIAIFLFRTWEWLALDR